MGKKKSRLFSCLSISARQIGNDILHSGGPRGRAWAGETVREKEVGTKLCLLHKSSTLLKLQRPRRPCFARLREEEKRGNLSGGRKYVYKRLTHRKVWRARLSAKELWRTCGAAESAPSAAERAAVCGVSRLRCARDICFIFVLIRALGCVRLC